MAPLLAVCLLLAWGAEVQASPFGPPYPITAAWFRDRFSVKEWNTALKEFSKIEFCTYIRVLLQGGDTVFLRAPPLRLRSRDDLASDPTFAWCRVPPEAPYPGGRPCYDQAHDDLTKAGLNVAGFLTYEYEEDFSDAIMACPQFERRINSSRVYYTLVLPTGNQSSPCNFTKGDSVVVVLTSFAGVDPHHLLLEAAERNNMSVYFGLPAAPFDFTKGVFISSLMTAYLHFADRVVQEHKARYSKLSLPTGSGSSRFVLTKNKQGHVVQHRLVAAPLFNRVKGYYSADECCLAQVSSPDSVYLALYASLGRSVRAVDKLMAIAPFLDTRRDQINATVQQHVAGFEAIVGTGVVDVVAVQEGRGAGKAAYYWPTQLDTPVVNTDPTLDSILHYQNPSLLANLTFRQAFTASVQEMFFGLEASQQALGKAGLRCQLWLLLEAFEFLRDQPCLPPDPQGSAMAELLNPTTKARLDGGLTQAGGRVQKVIAFAWDPDFLCPSPDGGKNLSKAILEEMDRPIMANCSFHSTYNRSIVVIGYNIDGMYGTFQVDYPDYHGTRHKESVYGYYFELDYGKEHNLVPSLVYIQMYDVAYVSKLNDTGYVIVSMQGANHDCVFTYDYSWESGHR